MAEFEERQREAERRAESGPTFRLQGNWKRHKGVATRYELALAIDRLLDLGKIEIVDGALRLTDRKGPHFKPLTPEERWRRQDERLRAYCQQMECKGTASRKLDGFALDPGGISFADAAAATAPRPGVIRYVLDELTTGRAAAPGPTCVSCPRCRMSGGPRGYNLLIDTIDMCGGLEWVNEDVNDVRGRARASRKAKQRAPK